VVLCPPGVGRFSSHCMPHRQVESRRPPEKKLSSSWPTDLAGPSLGHRLGAKQQVCWCWLWIEWGKAFANGGCLVG
jgi:hypothetical protein